MEEKAKKDKDERNRNIIILLLLLIIVAIAAQTTFFYNLISNLQEQQITIIKPPAKECIILKQQAPKSINSKIVKENLSHKEHTDEVKYQTPNKEAQNNTAAANKILNENVQLIPLGTKETDSQYTVGYKVSGAEKKNVSIRKDGNYLVIGVKINKEIKNNKAGEQFSLESYSTIHKTLQIPGNVDKNKISSTFKNGTLEILLPKIK
jgi:HSP20 family molecular chaperone IbpA